MQFVLTSDIIKLRETSKKYKYYSVIQNIIEELGKMPNPIVITLYLRNNLQPRFLILGNMVQRLYGNGYVLLYIFKT